VFFFWGGGGPNVMLNLDPEQNPELETLFFIFMTCFLKFMKLMCNGKMMDISPSTYLISEINKNNFVQCIV
jgi:hypothetical protein